MNTTTQEPSKKQVSWCSRHHNVSTQEILGPCWEQRAKCSLCQIEHLQERVDDLLCQLAEKVVEDSSDTPQFHRNEDDDIDFGPVAAHEPPPEQEPKSFAPWRVPDLPRADAAEALRPFVDLFEKSNERYRQRGGDPDQFKDAHPFREITARELPLGVWRRAQAALRAAPPPAEPSDIEYLMQSLIDQENVLTACEALLKESLAEDGVNVDFDSRLERYWEQSKALGDWRSRNLRLSQPPCPDVLERLREQAIHLEVEGGEDGKYVSLHLVTQLLGTVPSLAACQCLAVINTLIKPGDLQGNGCDETAQRNGVILAFNAVAEHQRSALTKPAEQEIPEGWCPICGGKDGEHKSGCQDGSEIL